MGEASLPLTEPVSERIPTRALSVLPDERLARMAAEGSARAFTAIYERHHQALYRYCRSILGNDEDARDALQNTMVAAMRALPGEERKIALKAWLFRVAHNEAISVVRRRTPESSIETAFEIPAEEADSETRDRLRALFTDLKQLPDRQRGALVMRELNGLGYAEIAAALETSEAGAKQLVYESRSSLVELERGREMECDSVREAISDRDGRVLRGRKLRAHLRSCSDCRAFRESIAGRRTQLQAMAPPLPAPAAAAILAGVLGGGGGSAGGGIAAALGGGAAAGGGLIGSAAMKAGIVAVAAGIGAGTIGLAIGGGDDAFSGGLDGSAWPGIGGPRGADAAGIHGGLGAPGPSGPGANGTGAGNGSDTGAGGGAAHGAGTGHHPGTGGSNTGAGEVGGGADEAPGVIDDPGTEPGGGANPGGGGSSGGGSPPIGAPPTAPPTGGSQGTGPTGTPPGQGGTPPGQGGIPPGLPVAPPGLGGTPPGQGGVVPGQAQP